MLKTQTLLLNMLTLELLYFFQSIISIKTKVFNKKNTYYYLINNNIF